MDQRVRWGLQDQGAGAPNRLSDPPYPPHEDMLSVGAPFPMPVVYTVGALGAAVGATSVWCIASGRLAWGTACALLFGVLAAMAFTFGPSTVRRAPPQLINAVTLSRAVVRPVDDWVHFYREDAMRFWDRCWMVLSGLGTGALLVFALIRVLVAPGGAWWLILFVPLLAVCAVGGLYALIQTVLDAKNSSFGRIPVGLALGRHGISRYWIAGGVTQVPWERIRSIEVLPHQLVRIEYGKSEPLKTGVGNFHEDAAWVHCALRFYFEHPELRHEVGTTVAQQRFEAWHRHRVT